MASQHFHRLHLDPKSRNRIRPHRHWRNFHPFGWHRFCQSAWSIRAFLRFASKWKTFAIRWSIACRCRSVAAVQLEKVRRWLLCVPPFSQWSVHLGMDRQTSSSNWTISDPAWRAQNSIITLTVTMRADWLTANDSTMNLVNKLGVSKHRPLTMSSHISWPSSQINATLSHVLKSSIRFLLKMAPWHWNLNNCSSNSLWKRMAVSAMLGIFTSRWPDPYRLNAVQSISSKQCVASEFV